MTALKKHNARKQAGVMGKTLTSWASSQGKNNTSIDVAKHHLTTIRQAVNNGGLSKSHSVTPQRHCGFFVPEICLAPQAGWIVGNSAAAALLRLQSVYDGMTPQNTTPFWGNMRGGSMRPRVNPVTHSASHVERVNTQKLIGVPIMAVGFQTPRGVWCYKLPDPFQKMPFLPVDDYQLAELLNISKRTALRICKGETTLRPCEIAYLQIMLLGVIPDPAFIKSGLFFRKGKLHSYQAHNFEASAGEVLETALLGKHYRLWNDELDNALKLAKQRIDELSQPKPPSNIIDFKTAASKRKGQPPQEGA